MTIKLKFLGFDSWQRAVFKNEETGAIYKNIMPLNLETSNLYDSDSFEGEPGWPVTFEGCHISTDYSKAQ